MRDERIFRTVAAVLLVSALSISGYHRHKVERAGEEQSPARREEGLPVAVGLRSSGLALMLSVAAYVLSLRRMEWARLDLSSWLRWLLVRLSKQEAKLIERFGDEYCVYTERTGNLVPRLR